MIGGITRVLAIFGILILYLWPRYFFVQIADKGVSGFTFFALLLLAASLVTLVLRRDIRRTVKLSTLNSKLVLATFVLFWLWRLTCDAAGITPLDSFGATLLDFFYLGAWMVIGGVLFGDARLRAALPYLIVIAGAVATVFGIWEYRSGQPLATTLGFSDFAAGDRYTLSRISSTIQRGNTIRVRSLFSHPLVYGQVMASMSPVALYFLLSGRGLRRIVGALLACCIGASIVVCNARSPFFVAGVGCIVYFVLFYLDLHRGSRLFILLWAVLALLVVAPIATGAFLHMAAGRTSEEAISSAARARQQDQGMDALVSRPVNGYGDGNATDIAGIIGEKGVRTIDNYYLTLSLDNGYVGVGIFMLMLAAMALQGLRLGSGARDDASRGMTCAATATIVALGVGLAILSITDTLSIIFLMAGYLVAMAGVTARARQRTAVPQRPRDRLFDP